MFKLNIDKKAIDTLIEILKKNGLTQIEVKDGKKSIRISKESIKLQNISKEINDKNDLQNNNKVNNKKENLPIENAIKAPMLGTLYHAPSPKAPTFIKVGKKVKVKIKNKDKYGKRTFGCRKILDETFFKI